MTETFTVRAVVMLLGIIALTSLIGAIYLVAVEKAVPGELWTTTATAIGALGALLARTSSTKNPPAHSEQPTEPPTS